MENTLKIGTHSGTFHADDAMGCMLLKNYTTKFKGAEVVRSRDKTTLDKLDIVIDVGDIYDVLKNRFDHHQRGFEETFDDKNSIKLSASGLVYKHFGLEIIGNALDELLENKILPENVKPLLTEDIKKGIWKSCYKGFFVTLDAIDNGVNRYPKSVKPKYHYYSTDLAARISRLNPNWWEPEDASLDERFAQAMDLCKEEFLYKLQVQVMGGVGSIPVVQDSIDAGVKGDGQIITLLKRCYWKEAVFTIEKQKGIVGQYKYILFEDTSSGSWRVQAVPTTLNTFDNRHPLKEEWRGKRDEELQELSGASDAIFCHHSGFIGGAKSYEGALKMALGSL